MEASKFRFKTQKLEKTYFAGHDKRSISVQLGQNQSIKSERHPHSPANKELRIWLKTATIPLEATSHTFNIRFQYDMKATHPIQ
jgi:hypothetical protein